MAKRNLRDIRPEDEIIVVAKGQNRSIERRAHLIITEIGVKQTPDDITFPKHDTNKYVAGYFTIGENKRQQYAAQICFEIGAKWERVYFESAFNNTLALCKQGVGNIWGITDVTAKEIFDEGVKVGKELKLNEGIE